IFTRGAKTRGSTKVRIYQLSAALCLRALVARPSFFQPVRRTKCRGDNCPMRSTAKGQLSLDILCGFHNSCDPRKTNCSSFVFHDGQDLFIVESIEKARSVS